MYDCSLNQRWQADCKNNLCKLVSVGWMRIRWRIALRRFSLKSRSSLKRFRNLNRSPNLLAPNNLSYLNLLYWPTNVIVLFLYQNYQHEPKSIWTPPRNCGSANRWVTGERVGRTNWGGYEVLVLYFDCWPKLLWIFISASNTNNLLTEELAQYWKLLLDAIWMYTERKLIQLI